MFILNTTIDDSSPLIIYSPAGDWAQGNADDIELGKYWRESYTYTWNAGAQALFTFNGTGITILGARRSVRGSYTVDLDEISEVLNATAPDPGEYQAVLFNATGLQQAQHTITVKNMDASVDIDCILELHVYQQIRWWSTVGSGELQEPSAEMNDDTESTFLWHPPDAWSIPLSNISQFNNGTGQFVISPLLYALRFIELQLHVSSWGISQLHFLSDAVSVFGTSGPQNRNYTVRIDDMVSPPFSAERDTYETSVLLFQADNLGAGDHMLSLVNSAEGGLLQIDYALSFTDNTTVTIDTSRVPSSTASSSTSPSGSSDTPPQSSLKAGAAAIVVALVVFISLLVAIWVSFSL
ncbi:uncharacterized protein BT62DRAFT_992657 [Guyanagaster necrorhizus]|uniref:Uncharacterized protein n=1 Tax=Guyanagaster necrorhizus TaxID=856835 RepID=A0A9P7VXY1_9AGAR|nr:uncharacterized protein BT62DRAFT_992657 [Guyanagaster necrorhizus MCA 3950]KAG7448643.1 hypothetical protein BT62DRAFT_992657 [Guyanagaster necrorhizus MCA 3950]